MVIENVMYFALGFLASGLLALMILPSVWNRAVRLTKSRIEAATPMTLAEFRADKDQLRAEFALSTRRLEKNVEALRTRLADQLSEINRKKSDLAQLKADRDQHITIIQELEGREGELRRRMLELEKEGTDLAQRLRMRDREFADKVAELDHLRVQGIHSGMSAGAMERLIQELAAERERSAYLQDRARSLMAQLEAAEHTGSDTRRAVAEMRRALAAKEDEHDAATDGIVEAEARLASAESRLNALLEENAESVEAEAARTAELLAEKLTLEEELEHLRLKIAGVETTIMQDWEAERVQQSHLRERLNDIASDVSRLVYAVDGDTSADAEESLFDRVTKYAGSGVDLQELSANKSQPEAASAAQNGLSDRMTALRDLRAR